MQLFYRNAKLKEESNKNVLYKWHTFKMEI